MGLIGHPFSPDLHLNTINKCATQCSWTKHLQRRSPGGHASPAISPTGYIRSRGLARHTRHGPFPPSPVSYKFIRATKFLAILKDEFLGAPLSAHLGAPLSALLGVPVAILIMNLANTHWEVCTIEGLIWSSVAQVCWCIVICLRTLLFWFSSRFGVRALTFVHEGAGVRSAVYYANILYCTIQN